MLQLDGLSLLTYSLKEETLLLKFLFWVTFLCVVGHFLFRKHFYSEALKEELFMKLEFLLK